MGLISAAVGMLWARLWGAVFPTGWHFKFMERWLRKGNGTDE